MSTEHLVEEMARVRAATDKPFGVDLLTASPDSVMRNVRAIIDKATITNTSANNVTVSVNLVTVSGSAGASNLIIDTRTIVPDETYLCPELVGQVLEAGSFISTIAGAGTSLTMRVSGREVS
jgi:hypothetical protein